MTELVQQLTASGALDAGALAWAQEALAARPEPLALSLLELDLVDEEGLVRGLEACHGLPAATPADLASADPAAGRRLPRHAADAFRLCPLLIEGDQLIALVDAALPAGSLLELRELFQLEVTPLIAAPHTIELAAGAVYGTPVSERVRRLEDRLARRRGALVEATLRELARAPDLQQAMAGVLDFAERVVDRSVFVTADEQGLTVLAGRPPVEAAVVPPPGADCSLAAAVRYRGYFLGPLRGNDADAALFAALGRPVPRWAFVAPVPGRAVAFLADNGDRPVAPRWVAELTLLVSRLAQHPEAAPVRTWGAWANAASEALDRIAPAVPAVDTPAASGAAGPADVPAAGVSMVERAVLERLRQAAAVAGLPLEQFVDGLLATAAAPPPVAAPPPAAMLAAEVKELFERLATDIPSQLARGMEAAFRGLAPRLAAGAAPPSAGAPGAPEASAAIQMVQAPAGPREVPSYRSKRAPVARRKL